MCRSPYSATAIALHPSVHRSISVIYCSFVDVALSVHSFPFSVYLCLHSSIFSFASPACMYVNWPMEQTVASTILLLKSIATTHKLTFWNVPDGRFLAMAALFGSELLLFRFVFIFQCEFVEYFFFCLSSSSSLSTSLLMLCFVWLIHIVTQILRNKKTKNKKKRKKEKNV